MASHYYLLRIYLTVGDNDRVPTLRGKQLLIIAFDGDIFIISALLAQQNRIATVMEGE